MKSLSIALAAGGLLIGSASAALFDINLSVTAVELQNSVNAGGGSYSGPVRIGLHSNPGAITPTATLAEITADFYEFGAPNTNFPGFLTNQTINLDDTGNAAPPNNTGQLYIIVGDADTNRAVFTDPAWVLGTFLDPPAPTPNVTVSLNASNQIVGGTGTLVSSGVAPGGQGFQLGSNVPIPEPSVALMLALGVGGLAVRRRRL